VQQCNSPAAIRLFHSFRKAGLITEIAVIVTSISSDEYQAAPVLCSQLGPPNNPTTIDTALKDRFDIAAGGSDNCNAFS
jgi:hypothetical protein